MGRQETMWIIGSTTWALPPPKLANRIQPLSIQNGLNLALETRSAINATFREPCAWNGVDATNGNFVQGSSWKIFGQCSSSTRQWLTNSRLLVRLSRWNPVSATKNQPALWAVQPATTRMVNQNPKGAILFIGKNAPNATLLPTKWAKPLSVQLPRQIARPRRMPARNATCQKMALQTLSMWR